MRNTTVVAPPKTPEEGYHLSEDLADDAVDWLRNHKALQADRPFFMYWASGCLHGPHHIMKEWADRYGQVRRRMGCLPAKGSLSAPRIRARIPRGCELTDRDERMKGWEDIPEDERPFQCRLMEVAAGFAEHCDVQVGRIVDELDRLGYADNTLFLYIWVTTDLQPKDRTAPSPNCLRRTAFRPPRGMHIDALKQLGGLDVLGSPKTDNQYHSGWGWEAAHRTRV